MPLKPELALVAARMFAVIDAVQVEFPGTRGAITDVLDGDAVPDFPAEALSGFSAGDGALPVFYKVLPLVIGDNQFGEHLPLIFNVDHVLRKEVSRSEEHTSELQSLR